MDNYQLFRAGIMAEDEMEAAEGKRPECEHEYDSKHWSSCPVCNRNRWMQDRVESNYKDDDELELALFDREEARAINKQR